MYTKPRYQSLTPLFLLLVALAGAPAAAKDATGCPEAFTPYDAEFTALYNGTRMKGTRRLQRGEDGSYLLAHQAKIFGASILEESRFSVADERIRGDRYDMERAFFGVKREFHVRYDWEKGQARLSGRYKGELPLDEHPLDLLTYQVALRCDLAKGNRGETNYPVIAKNLIRGYRFKVKGEEHLDTEMGRLETLVVERLRDNNERTTLLWVAPELNYMVVRLKQYEKDDNATYQLDISKITFN